MDSSEYLGFIIDHELKWNKHSHSINSKLKSKVYMMRQLRKTVSTDVLINLYYAEVHSLLQYGIYIWGYSSQTQDLLKTQKQILRIIFNKPAKEHCKPLFKNSRIMTVVSLYLYETLKAGFTEGHITEKSANDRNKKNTRNVFIENVLPKNTWDEKRLRFRSVEIFNKLPKSLKTMFMAHSQ